MALDFHKILLVITCALYSVEVVKTKTIFQKFTPRKEYPQKLNRFLDNFYHSKEDMRWIEDNENFILSAKAKQGLNPERRTDNHVQVSNSEIYDKRRNRNNFPRRFRKIPPRPENDVFPYMYARQYFHKKRMLDQRNKRNELLKEHTRRNRLSNKNRSKEDEDTGDEFETPSMKVEINPRSQVGMLKRERSCEDGRCSKFSSFKFPCIGAKCHQQEDDYDDLDDYDENSSKNDLEDTTDNSKDSYENEEYDISLNKNKRKNIMTWFNDIADQKKNKDEDFKNDKSHSTDNDNNAEVEEESVVQKIVPSNNKEDEKNCCDFSKYKSEIFKCKCNSSVTEKPTSDDKNICGSNKCKKEMKDRELKEKNIETESSDYEELESKNKDSLTHSKLKFDERDPQMNEKKYHEISSSKFTRDHKSFGKEILNKITKPGNKNCNTSDVSDEDMNVNLPDKRYNNNSIQKIGIDQYHVGKNEVNESHKFRQKNSKYTGKKIKERSRKKADESKKSGKCSFNGKDRNTCESTETETKNRQKLNEKDKKCSHKNKKEHGSEKTIKNKSMILNKSRNKDTMDDLSPLVITNLNDRHRKNSNQLSEATSGELRKKVQELFQNFKDVENSQKNKYEISEPSVKIVDLNSLKNENSNLKDKLTSVSSKTNDNDLIEILLRMLLKTNIPYSKHIPSDSNSYSNNDPKHVNKLEEQHEPISAVEQHLLLHNIPESSKDTNSVTIRSKTIDEKIMKRNPTEKEIEFFGDQKEGRHHVKKILKNENNIDMDRQYKNYDNSYKNRDDLLYEDFQVERNVRNNDEGILKKNEDYYEDYDNFLLKQNNGLKKRKLLSIQNENMKLINSVTENIQQNLLKNNNFNDSSNILLSKTITVYPIIRRKRSEDEDYEEADPATGEKKKYTKVKNSQVLFDNKFNEAQSEDEYNARALNSNVIDNKFYLKREDENDEFGSIPAKEKMEFVEEKSFPSTNANEITSNFPPIFVFANKVSLDSNLKCQSNKTSCIKNNQSKTLNPFDNCTTASTEEINDYDDALEFMPLDGSNSRLSSQKKKQSKVAKDPLRDIVKSDKIMYSNNLHRFKNEIGLEDVVEYHHSGVNRRKLRQKLQNMESLSNCSQTEQITTTLAKADTEVTYPKKITEYTTTTINPLINLKYLEADEKVNDYGDDYYDSDAKYEAIPHLRNKLFSNQKIHNELEKNKRKLNFLENFHNTKLANSKHILEKTASNSKSKNLEKQNPSKLKDKIISFSPHHKAGLFEPNKAILIDKTKPYEPINRLEEDSENANYNSKRNEQSVEGKQINKFNSFNPFEEVLQHMDKGRYMKYSDNVQPVISDKSLDKVKYLHHYSTNIDNLNNNIPVYQIGKIPKYELHPLPNLRGRSPSINANANNPSVSKFAVHEKGYIIPDKSVLYNTQLLDDKSNIIPVDFNKISNLKNKESLSVLHNNQDTVVSPDFDKNNNNHVIKTVSCSHKFGGGIHPVEKYFKNRANQQQIQNVNYHFHKNNEPNLSSNEYLRNSDIEENPKSSVSIKVSPKLEKIEQTDDKDKKIVSNISPHSEVSKEERQSNAQENKNDFGDDYEDEILDLEDAKRYVRKNPRKMKRQMYKMKIEPKFRKKYAISKQNNFHNKMFNSLHRNNMFRKFNFGNKRKRRATNLMPNYLQSIETHKNGQNLLKSHRLRNNEATDYNEDDYEVLPDLLLNDQATFSKRRDLKEKFPENKRKVLNSQDADDNLAFLITSDIIDSSKAGKLHFVDDTMIQNPIIQNNIRTRADAEFDNFEDYAILTELQHFKSLMQRAIDEKSCQCLNARQKAFLQEITKYSTPHDLQFRKGLTFQSDKEPVKGDFIFKCENKEHDHKRHPKFLDEPSFPTNHHHNDVDYLKKDIKNKYRKIKSLLNDYEELDEESKAKVRPIRRYLHSNLQILRSMYKRILLEEEHVAVPKRSNHLHKRHVISKSELSPSEIIKNRDMKGKRIQKKDRYPLWTESKMKIMKPEDNFKAVSTSGANHLTRNAKYINDNQKYTKEKKTVLSSQNNLNNKSLKKSVKNTSNNVSHKMAQKVKSNSIKMDKMAEKSVTSNNISPKILKFEGASQISAENVHEITTTSEEYKRLAEEIKKIRINIERENNLGNLFGHSKDNTRDKQDYSDSGFELPIIYSS